MKKKCLPMPSLPGSGRRDSPKKCWREVVKVFIRANGLTPRQTKDRAKWKRKSRKVGSGLQGVSFRSNWKQR